MFPLPRASEGVNPAAGPDACRIDIAALRAISIAECALASEIDYPSSPGHDIVEQAAVNLFFQLAS